MPTRELNGITLERVREHVWEIPQEGGMNAPARVLASDTLLSEIANDKTLEQLRNASHLPGITSHAICMPDGHQGYGFPVGGVGAIDAETGCISPGAVGYDINCLAGDTEVQLPFGRRRAISDLRPDFERQRAVVPAGDTAANSDIRLVTETPSERVLEVETASGDTITATPDHPFRTPDGTVPTRDLEPGTRVFTRPFEGLPDEEPAEFVVLDERDVTAAGPDTVEALTQRGLLPLRSTDRAFHRLLKLVGYHTGAGVFEGARTWFYGDARGLERLRDDIAALGFDPTAVSECDPPDAIDASGSGSFDHRVGVESSGFRTLLTQLGAAKTGGDPDDVTVPEYLDRLPAWGRALYLSAFFGAAMSPPVGPEGRSVVPPGVSRARSVSSGDTGGQFLQEVRGLLEEFDIPTTGHNPTAGVERRRDERRQVGFRITTDSEALLEFLSHVGYRYAREKREMATLVCAYLKRTRDGAGSPPAAAVRQPIRTDGGVTAATTSRPAAGSEPTGDRTVLPADRSGRDSTDASTSFRAFAANVEIEDDLTVATPVVAVREAGREPVYDIGVAHEAHAFVANGVVVGNCGVRMMRTDLTYDDIRGQEETLVESLFANIPSGLGGGGIVEGDRDTVEAVLRRGVDWAVEEGYATREDLARCEDEGRRPDARPEFVSQKAKDRGRNQLGSLGSGNHFLEVQRVTDLYDQETAAAFGLQEDQVVVLIHCGSRGLGHQVCTDFLREIEEEHADLLADLPDKELAAAPAGSRLAEEYYGAMCAAINFAWVNRQLVMHRTRRVFERVFGEDWEAMGMELLYDVAHNIAKREVHDVGVDADGTAVPRDRAVDTEERDLYVHRKGATRAFPAGRPEVPASYRDVGQPVIIPGSMGAGSYVLVGGAESMGETFGSTAHGAGRVMSRTRAKDEYWGETVQDELREQQAIYVKAQSGATVAEEAPGVYKDVDEVVRVSDALGIGDKVARTYPVCNIKG